MNPQTIEFIEILEANPFTPIEVLFVDFYGKEKAHKLTINSILQDLDPENREKMVDILNSAGYNDVL